jgi:hypothetical protein
VIGIPDVRHQRTTTLIFNEGMGHLAIKCTFFLSKRENIAPPQALKFKTASVTAETGY